MSNIYPIQNSFAAGELAPSLYGRTDLAKYSVGLKRCENMVIHPHGGVSKRAGMRKVSVTKYQDRKCRLVPFQFSLGQRFILEFGDQYIRFIDENGEQVMDPDNELVPYEIESPYAEADLPRLSFAQSADVVYIAHNNYPPYELARLGRSNWTINKFAFRDGPFIAKDPAFDDITIGVDKASGTVTARSSHDFFVPGHVGSIFKITHYVEDSKAKATGNAGGTTTAYTIQSRKTFAYTKPKGEDFQDYYNILFYAPQALVADGTFRPGVVFVVGDGYSAKTYTVTSISSTVSTGYQRLYVSPDPGTTTSSATQTITAKITTTPSIWGVDVYVYKGWSVESNGFWGGTVFLQRYLEDEMRWVNVRTYSAPLYADGTTSTAAAKNYSDSGEVDEPTQFRLLSTDFFAYKPSGNSEMDRGYFTLTANQTMHSAYMTIVSVETPRSATAEITTAAALTSPTLLWEEGAWGEKNGYPATVGFYEERIVFGNTKAEPQSYWMSRVGDYYDFGLSSPIQDDDPITGTLVSRRVSRIHHFIAFDELVALTDSSEWKISVGVSGNVMTPTNVASKAQGYRGCADIEPIVVGDMVLFVQSQCARVRDLGYSFETDNYTGNDLTILANHIFREHRIVDWCYAQEPDSMCWIIRDDGALVSLTYLREHDVVAWGRHPLPGGGVAESITSVRTETGDDVYVVMRRNGVRTVECMSPQVTSEPEEAFFLDGGVTVRGDSDVTAVAGLWHLEGMMVSIVADGSVLGDQVVTGGAVTLASAASVVHVGLPYDAIIETLDLNIPRRDGSQMGRKLRVSKCILQYEDSRGLFIGTDEEHMSEQIDRTDEASGEPTRLTSGYYTHTLDSGYDSGSLVVKAPYPMPASVLSLTPVVDPVAAFS